MEEDRNGMLVAVVSVKTTTGTHDDYCSGNECEDEYGFLDEIEVVLKGSRSAKLESLCEQNPHYLKWLLSELELDFQKTHVSFGSGYCSESKSGLHHEMIGTVTTIHSLELVAPSRLAHKCYVNWNSEVYDDKFPEFIRQQLLTLFLCVKKLNYPLCHNMRQYIGKVLLTDWISFKHSC